MGCHVCRSIILYSQLEMAGLDCPLCFYEEKLGENTLIREGSCVYPKANAANPEAHLLPTPKALPVPSVDWPDQSEN